MDRATLLVLDKLFHLQEALLEVGIDQVHDFDVARDSRLWFLLELLLLEIFLKVVALASLFHCTYLVGPMLSHLLLQENEALNQNFLLVRVTVLNTFHRYLTELIKVAQLDTPGDRVRGL